MGKKLSLSATLIFAFFLVLVLPQTVSASHRQDVLGDSVSASETSMPATAEGPGIILPDSHLFFLDTFKQNLRLLFAWSPSARAKVHAAIAGERLAELQFMLAKNDEDGIRAALLGVSDNLKKAAENLSQGKLKGQDVKLLARTVNDSIKDKQKKLSVLENQAKGELKAQVKAVKEALKAAKVEAEDSLPEDELENEIEDDIEEEIEDHARVASDSAKGISRAVDVLSNLANKANEKHQTRREEALRRAIEVKNEVLKKQQERVLELENKKQEKLSEARGKAIEKARQAADKVGEAAQRLQEVREEVREAKDESKSGSSNSGSGNSDSSEDREDSDREDSNSGRQ